MTKLSELQPSKTLKLSGKSVVIDCDRQTGDSELEAFEAWWETAGGDFSSAASAAKHAAWLSWQAALSEAREGSR